MPLINITGAIENVTDPVGIFTELNVITEGYLGVAMLFMFFVITLSYASAKMSSNLEAFTQSSILTSLVSMLMYAMGVISWKYAFIPVVMAIIGVALVHGRNN